jgi:hypothetical protein
MWITVGFVAVILPPALGGLLAGLVHLFGVHHMSPFREVASLGTILLSAGFFGWVGVVIGIFIFRFALRRGFAGWGVAISVGAVLPTVIFCILLGTLSFLGVMTFFGTLGALHAGALWLALRWLVPEFFAKPGSNA